MDASPGRASWQHSLVRMPRAQSLPDERGEPLVDVDVQVAELDLLRPVGRHGALCRCGARLS